MSTQKGNNHRSRPQKHQNKTSFKNSLHDTSDRTKFINNIQVRDVCQRCKEIIEWKIKYKKYKPLTQPKKCVRCEERKVRQAYHVICADCGKKDSVCTKCCNNKEVITEVTKEEQIKLDNEMKAVLQSLPERKRRSFIRYMNKQAESDCQDLKSKLEALKLDENDDDDDDFDDFV